MSEPILIAESICPRCTASVPAGAARCPHCGAALDDARPPLQERRWFILCMLVFAALFLGFPYLWRSRSFSLAEKIFWTILVSLESIVVFWIFYLVMADLVKNIRTLL